MVSSATPYRGLFISIYVALVFGSFLAGLTTLQTFAFFWWNRWDPTAHKLFVAFIWALAILQITIHASAVWKCDFSQGLSSEFIQMPWEIRIRIFMLYLLAVIPKAFYLIRIWKALEYRNKRPALAVVLAFLLFLELAFGTAIGYFIYAVKVVDLLPAVPPVPLASQKLAASVGLIAVALTTLNDVLVAMGLVYACVKNKINFSLLGHLSKADSGMILFCAYILSSGLIPALFSLVGMSAYARDGLESPILVAVVIILPQVHAMCFLSMMNARLFFRRFCQETIFLPTEIEFTHSQIFDIRPQSASQAPSASDRIDDAELGEDADKKHVHPTVRVDK